MTLPLPSLLDYDLEQLEALMEQLGQPRFRAAQLAKWLAAGVSFDKMSNIPASLKQPLMGSFVENNVKIQNRYPSSLDDTVKYLYLLEDSNIIEGVRMTYEHGRTLCISTQVGCRMGCTFCASTIGGLVRNLTAGEMLGQIAAINSETGEQRAITNVVLMGSGEPLENYDNTVRFIRMANAPWGMGISIRNISLSTCGLVPEMLRLAQEGLPVTLSVSLHAPDDETRRMIMPIANAYSIRQVMDAVRIYIEKTGRRVIIEYAMIKGINDTQEHAEKLAAVVRGLQCHVNLIPLNRVEEKEFEPSAMSAVKSFLSMLEQLHVSATIRRELGADISGACGQLRRTVLSSES